MAIQPLILMMQTEGVNYYIGNDGTPYYYSDIRTTNESQRNKVSYDSGTITITDPVTKQDTVLQQGIDFYIGSDGNAHNIVGAPSQGTTQVVKATDDPTANKNKSTEGTSQTEFILPVDPTANNTYITSLFGWRYAAGGTPDHRGWDMASTYGSDIFSIGDTGKVVKAAKDLGSTAGRYVIIQYEYQGEKFYAAYYHMSNVEEGQIVNKGEVIGSMGGSGVKNKIPSDTAYTTHLHFQTFTDLDDRNESAFDPFSGENV